MSDAPQNLSAPPAKQVHNRVEIERAIERLATEISRDYRDKCPLLLGVMTGAVPFLGQLMLRLPMALQIDYIHVTRYRNQTQGGNLEWLVEPRSSLRERDVLIVDDILDEGHTLKEIISYCWAKGASSVEVVVLADKPNPRRVQNLEARYVGLEVPDCYVFGYGMDYQSYWRNLDGIYCLVDDAEDVGDESQQKGESSSELNNATDAAKKAADAARQPKAQQQAPLNHSAHPSTASSSDKGHTTDQ